MSPKGRGHYCKICGQRKSNESFSGKGHATHICKACAKLSPEQRSLQMTLNRLDSFAFRYLSKAEIEWLKNAPTISNRRCGNWQGPSIRNGSADRRLKDLEKIQNETNSGGI